MDGLRNHATQAIASMGRGSSLMENLGCVRVYFMELSCV